jgi:tetratricopeptide (TPR) repeat protein
VNRGAAAVLSLLLGAAAALAVAPRAAPAQSPAALLAAGDAAWSAGDHAAAFRAYDAVVRADSSYSTRAVLRLGTLHAWAERLPQAIACHTLHVRLEPDDLDGRVALGRTLAWASRHAQSLAQYDTVLAREPAYRDAVIGRATTLAWWGRLAAADAALARWQAAHPDDAEAALLRARFLSWDGRLEAALAVYDSLAAAGGAEGAAAAEKGRARVLAWRGDLTTSERRWRAITARAPDDAEAWVGLGQVLRWQGRTFAAREALERATALDPSSSDAREQLRWVAAETSPSSAMDLVHTDDSERNVSTTLGLSGTVVRPWHARVTGAVRWRSVSQAGGDALLIPAAMGTVQWQPRGGVWTLRADAGAVRFPEGMTASTVVMQGGARVAGRIGARVTVGTGASRAPFDDIVAAASRRLGLTLFDADVGVALHPHLTLGVAGSTGYASGDIARNDRVSGLASLRWAPGRAVHLALMHRDVRWDRAVPGVFFAPQRFAVSEVSARWEWPRDLGLIASGEAGLGLQRVRFADGEPSRRATPRAALRLGWRPRPGRELVAGLQYANVASAGAVGGSDYRFGAATLTARWVF